MTLQACCEACNDPDGKLRVTRVNGATAEVCGCEVFSVSEHSPGIVADEEILHFIVGDPTHLLEGRIAPNALMQIDLGGLSVLRGAAADQEFEFTIRALRQRAHSASREWFFYGVVAFYAGAIRYEQGGERFLCVYDTAMQDKPHHADVMGPDLTVPSVTVSKTAHEKAKRARLKLVRDRIEPNFTPAHLFRQGAFVQYARPS